MPKITKRVGGTMGNSVFNLCKISFVTLTKQKVIISILLLVQIVCCIALMYSFAIGEFFINMSREPNIFEIDYDDSGATMAEVNANISKLDKYSDVEVYFAANKNIVASINSYHINVLTGRLIDNTSATNQAIIPMDAAGEADIKINDMVTILDKEYTVVGLSADTIEVNWLSIADDARICNVKIINDKVRNNIAEKKYNKVVARAFNKDVTAKPQAIISEIANGAVLNVLILLLVTMCTISFAIAIKSIQDKRKTSFRVLALIGMSKLKAYVWMVLEISVICIFVWIVAALIYFILDICIFYKILSGVVFPQLTIWNYLMLGGIYTVFVGVIASLISTKELFRNNKNKN